MFILKYILYSKEKINARFFFPLHIIFQYNEMILHPLVAKSILVFVWGFLCISFNLRLFIIWCLLIWCSPSHWCANCPICSPFMPEGAMSGWLLCLFDMALVVLDSYTTFCNNKISQAHLIDYSLILKTDIFPKSCFLVVENGA